jgi:DNA-binding NarL/FixJ family response regulator
MQQAANGAVRLVVVVGHSGTTERKRAVARRGSGIEIVRPSATDPGALHLLTDARADVLILDVRLPEIGGDEVAAELRRGFPGLQVIVLAGYDHVAYLRKLVAAGDQLFRGPSFAGEDIVAAARSAVDRRCLLSAETLLTKRGGLAEPLTRSEYETLRLMAAGRHNREIAAELGIATKTVEFHVTHVLEKLEVHSRVEAILKARQLSAQDGTASGTVA